MTPRQLLALLPLALATAPALAAPTGSPSLPPAPERPQPAPMRISTPGGTFFIYDDARTRDDAHRADLAKDSTVIPVPSTAAIARSTTPPLPAAAHNPSSPQAKTDHHRAGTSKPAPHARKAAAPNAEREARIHDQKPLHDTKELKPSKPDTEPTKNTNSKNPTTPNAAPTSTSPRAAADHRNDDHIHAIRTTPGRGFTTGSTHILPPIVEAPPHQG